jgi:hypothetical protein
MATRVTSTRLVGRTELAELEKAFADAESGRALRETDRPGHGQIVATNGRRAPASAVTSET